VPGAAAALAVSSFSPVSGTIGTEVTIRGSGFADVTGVRFGGAAGEFSVKSSAEITATVPAGACTGPVTVTSRAGTADSPEAFTVRPGIVLSAPGGPPGTTVTVAGAGFAADEAVDIYLGADFSLTDQALASASSGGAFSGIAAQIPVSAPSPGTAYLTAVGRHSGLSAQAQFSVFNTVTVTSPGNQASVTGTAVRLPVSASDTGPGQALSFTAAGLPPGLDIAEEPGAAGVIAGTPAAPGDFTVTVTARDGTGASGSAAFSWSVTNTVAVINPGSQASTFGIPASLQIQATDSQAGQALAWTAAGLPPGLSAGPATGLISGIPAQAGDFAVTVTARDSTGASGSAAFGWAIGNQVTVISPANQVTVVGASVSLQIQVTDSASGQAFTWTAEGLPPGLSINPVTGEISGAPALEFPLAHQVTVTASDTTGASGYAVFQWEILG
jgi:Putative Ig domain/IPT/TIG domain